MFIFILQLLFFTAVLLLFMFIFGALMPILTHPIASILICGLFVLFAISVYKASQR
jgi:hypothetical protein